MIFEAPRRLLSTLVVPIAFSIMEHRQADRLPAAPLTNPPTLEELANATFPDVAAVPVSLSGGRWEGEPFVEGGASRPTVGLIEDFQLTGDLDGDGGSESVVLLWSSSGGSGTFIHLAAAARDGDDVVLLGTAELGDRVKVSSGRVIDGRIELEVVQAGPDDAVCCPTQTATRIWALEASGLNELTHVAPNGPAQRPAPPD